MKKLEISRKICALRSHTDSLLFAEVMTEIADILDDMLDAIEEIDEKEYDYEYP